MTKILLYDLEVSPTLAWTYRLWDANIIRIERDQHLMCFSYKWLGEDTIQTVSLPDFPLYKKDKFNDKHVVHALRDLFDEADIVVAHNANKFDNKVLTERMIIHGEQPFSPVRTLDTYAAAKRHFYHDNSLAALCRKLGVEGKTATKHHDVWYACLQGDLLAWDAMAEYCENDIRMLEDVYLKMRPYITNHPNVDEEGVSCPKCGSVEYQSRGYYNTNSASYRKYQCNTCHGWFSSRLADKDVAKPNYKSI